MSGILLKVKTFFKKYGWKALIIWVVWNVVKFTVGVKLIKIVGASLFN